MPNVIEQSALTSLDDVVGNMPWVERLRSFVRQRRAGEGGSWSFLMLGTDGTCKTEIVKAVARELGAIKPGQCAKSSMDFCVEGPSSLASAENVRTKLQEAFRYGPWDPAAWKIICFEEASKFSPEVLQELKLLIDPARLPRRTVVFFLSNDAAIWYAEQRKALVGRRLEVLDCDSWGEEDPATIAQEVIGRAWERSTGLPADTCPLSAESTRGADGLITPGRALTALQAHIEARETAPVYSGSPECSEDDIPFAEPVDDTDLAPLAPSSELTPARAAALAAALQIPVEFVATCWAQYQADIDADTTDRKRARVETYLACLGVDARPSLRSIACVCAVSFEYARKIVRECRPDLAYVS